MLWGLLWDPGHSQGWTAPLRSPLLSTLERGLCVRCAQPEDLGQPPGPPHGQRSNPGLVRAIHPPCLHVNRLGVALGWDPRTPSLGKT